MRYHTVNINTSEAPAMVASVVATSLFLLIEKLDELIGKLPDGYDIEFSLSFKKGKNAETGESLWIGAVSIEMIFRALQSGSREAARLTLTRVSLEISESGGYRWRPFQPEFVKGRELDLASLVKATETGIGRSPDDNVYRENLAIRLPSELPMFIDMNTMQMGWSLPQQPEEEEEEGETT